MNERRRAWSFIAATVALAGSLAPAAASADEGAIAGRWHVSGKIDPGTAAAKPTEADVTIERISKDRFAVTRRARDRGARPWSADGAFEGRTLEVVFFVRAAATTAGIVGALGSSPNPAPAEDNIVRGTYQLSRDGDVLTESLRNTTRKKPEDRWVRIETKGERAERPAPRLRIVRGRDPWDDLLVVPISRFECGDGLTRDEPIVRARAFRFEIELEDPSGRAPGRATLRSKVAGHAVEGIALEDVGGGRFRSRAELEAVAGEPGSPNQLRVVEGDTVEAVVEDAGGARVVATAPVPKLRILAREQTNRLFDGVLARAGKKAVIPVELSNVPACPRNWSVQLHFVKVRRLHAGRNRATATKRDTAPGCGDGVRCVLGADLSGPGRVDFAWDGDVLSFPVRNAPNGRDGERGFAEPGLWRVVATLRPVYVGKAATSVDAAVTACDRGNVFVRQLVRIEQDDGAVDEALEPLRDGTPRDLARKWFSGHFRDVLARDLERPLSGTDRKPIALRVIDGRAPAKGPVTTLSVRRRVVVPEGFGLVTDLYGIAPQLSLDFGNEDAANSAQVAVGRMLECLEGDHRNLITAYNARNANARLADDGPGRIHAFATWTGNSAAHEIGHTLGLVATHEQSDGEVDGTSGSVIGAILDPPTVRFVKKAWTTGEVVERAVLSDPTGRHNRTHDGAPVDGTDLMDAGATTTLFDEIDERRGLRARNREYLVRVLPVGCAACGRAEEPSDRFCQECGTALVTGDP